MTNLKINTRRAEHTLITSRFTELWRECKDHFGAPHYFEVRKKNGDEIGEFITSIKMQEGPVKELGINGVMNEDLLAIVLIRLEGFQKTEFACRENAIAITKLEEALMWLNRRTKERELRGVEGTSQK